MLHLHISDRLSINISLLFGGSLEARWQILRTPGLTGLWVSSGVIMQGFDIVAGGQLVSLPEFQKQFGRLQPDGSHIIPAHYLSAWNSIAPACEIASTFIYAPLLEKYGRKPGILVASAISVAGVLLQQLATDWRVHLAGRGVNGIAIGMMFTISPLWIGETCRPELRGFFLCFFNTSIVFGQFAIAAVARGSSYLDGKWQWWLPVVGMYIFPGKAPSCSDSTVAHITAILTFGWLFFPESPYWLVRQRKTTQAQNSLRRVYGFKNDAFYDVEVRRMETENNQALALQGSLAQSNRRTFLGLDLSAEAECFDRMNRKRTLTAIFAASGQQMIGATFVIGYATYFLDLIGVKDYFDASIVLYVVMLLASMAAFPLTEIIGRRTMIVIPQFILCCMLLLIGILGCVPDHGKASWGIIVFIYIWAIIYQLSIGAVGFVLASEIATVRLRSTTQGLVTITNAAWGLIMQFTIPYMINPDAGNLGGKVGFIFFGTGLIAAIGGWYLYPETKGISFEAMDELYASGTAPRLFRTASEQQRGIPLESKTEPPVHVEDVNV
ncbi:putative MFS alpha-glucoside transporter [Aspergillus fischeri NRRL 181]|uniref:MFS transporter, putative n=1 Tax=Neosartorya fischeri (strain ATCC 1020 / DSM 3700 / CBS 544.65 / FGSC A1164 / JCM 1740 / NRRL 181 / WB 181) TaxID=331117 RepID=A1D0V3_NEOFI|nr:MFS transporter, putative [Aspergillus fischeri NRRL 181]EAW24623.1 MFS transporter, putative [Aspergillus fischeri NRRL 181]